MTYLQAGVWTPQIYWLPELLLMYTMEKTEFFSVSIKIQQVHLQWLFCGFQDQQC